MTQERREVDTAAMEQGGRGAMKALEALVLRDEESAKAVKLVAAWWAEWYPKAGHRRLARSLLGYAPKRDRR